MKSVIDNNAAYELYLYANNDYITYASSIEPMCKCIGKKVKNGTFNQDKAVTGFAHCMEFAAKRYCKEFGGIWYQVFNKQTRIKAATEMCNDFINEFATIHQ